MNRSDYLNEGYKQLEDEQFYRRVDEALTHMHINEVMNQVEDLYQNGEIDENVCFHIVDKSCKVACFYLLPKIHKNKFPPPGRPFIAGIGCPTEKISQFVVDFINPCSTKVRSYKRETNDNS